MKTTQPLKPGNPKLVTIMPLFGPEGFLDWDYDRGAPVYMGGKIRPLTRQEMLEILIRNQNNPEHFPRDPSKCPNTDCIMCGRPKSKVWITTIMCEECYTNWVGIMHNSGDNLNLPTYFLEAARSHRYVRGKNIFLHFKSKHSQPKMTSYGFNQRIYLGMKNMRPILVIGKNIIPLDPVEDYVEIYQAFTMRRYMAKIDIYIHEPIEVDGKVLEGCFSNCTLLGKVICDQAFLGECLSLRDKAVQWPAHAENIKDYKITIVDCAYPEQRLNEMITPAGVTGITQAKLEMIEESQALTCVNSGDYCPRCSDERLLKKKINMAQKEFNNKVPVVHVTESETNQTIKKMSTFISGDPEVLLSKEREEKPVYQYSNPRPPLPTKRIVSMAAPDTITVPKGHYTDLLTQIEKLKQDKMRALESNKKLKETTKSLRSDLAIMRSRLQKKGLQPVPVEVQEAASSEENL